jgi:murein DD-endopeptidase MepM/ murein hydrolase activator NlpD
MNNKKFQISNFKFQNFNLKIQILISLFLFLFFISIPVQAKVDKATQERIKLKIETHKTKLHQIKSRLHVERYRLQVINQREEDLSHQLSKTQDELFDTRITIDSLKSRMKQLRVQLEVIEYNLGVLKSQLAIQKKALMSRLKDIYYNGELDYLSCLLNSTSFADFLNRMDFLSLIIKSDYKLINFIKFKTDKYEQMKALRLQKAYEISKTKNDYSYNEQYLTKLEGQRKNILSEVSAQRREVADYVNELEHLSKAMEEQLENIIRYAQKINQEGRVHLRGTGIFSWPVNGSISSPYGWRIHPIYGTYKFHTGIDLAASYGEIISATSDGIVIYTGWYDGYGNTVIIDHGSGYSSLYAHCSSILVRNGQTVYKGEAIARVGSTGNSTGPHLHFEIRQNGSPINPMGKLS